MHPTQHVPRTYFGVRDPDAAEHIDRLAETLLDRLGRWPAPWDASRSLLLCDAIAGTTQVPPATRKVEGYGVRGSSLAAERCEIRLQVLGHFLDALQPLGVALDLLLQSVHQRREDRGGR